MSSAMADVEQTTLAPRLLARILEQVDLHRWGAAGSMFALCWEIFVDGQVPPDEGITIAAARAGREIGAGFPGSANGGRGAAKRALARLVDDGVLRVGLDAAGARAHAYVFVHEIGEWAGVPWRQRDPETGQPITAWQAKAIIEGHLRPVRGAKPAFVARHSARLGPVVARSGARQSDPERAPWRATNPAGSARHSARLAGFEPPAPPLSQLQNPPPTPTSDRTTSTEAPADLSSNRGRRVFAEIHRLSGAWLGSKEYKRRVVAAVERSGVDLDALVVELRAQAAPGAGPPVLAELAISIADVMAHDHEDGPTIAARERRARVVELRRRLDSFRAQVTRERAIAIEGGWDYEMGDDLASKMAACENELAQLEVDEPADHPGEVATG